MWQPSSAQPRYLPPPAAPDWMASRNQVMLREPDTWLGGYSLNVVKNMSHYLYSGNHRPQLIAPPAGIQSAKRLDRLAITRLIS